MYSGKFGNQMVYRNRDGVSILAKMPKKNPKTATRAQLDARRKFRMASRWAKQALLDPEMLAEYTRLASGMKTSYVMAMTNYLRPPEVREILVSEYKGAIGDRIGVVATDDFRVISVKVSVKDAAGTLIEEGPCVEDLSADCWVYTATQAIDDLTGLVITAVATDIPNHPASLDLTL
jgi:hypothetical protein